MMTRETDGVATRDVKTARRAATIEDAIMTTGIGIETETGTGIVDLKGIGIEARTETRIGIEAKIEIVTGITRGIASKALEVVEAAIDPQHALPVVHQREAVRNLRNRRTTATESCAARKWTATRNSCRTSSYDDARRRGPMLARVNGQVARLPAPVPATRLCRLQLVSFRL